MDKRLLVTGGAGLIGSRFIQLTAKDFTLFSIDRSELPEDIKDGAKNFKIDITQKSQVEEVVKETAPDWILHFAAITDVEGCEKDSKIKDLSWEVNVGGTRNMVWAAQSALSAGPIPVLYTSTDFVFDGKHGPYSEERSTNPVTAYGKTKLEGEKIVSSLARYQIVRLAYPYRAHFEGKRDIVRWMLKTLQNGKVLELVTDQYITPTFIDDLVKAMVVLIKNGATGVYHVAGRDRLNFFQMGVQVAEVFGLDKNLIRATTPAELVKKLDLKAKRPTQGGLKIDKFLAEFGDQIKLLSFRDSLEEIKKQIAKEDQSISLELKQK